MYEVIIERSVTKQLKKIPASDYTKIKMAILDLSANPRPHGYLKLKGRDGFRIRAGDYRIIYEIDDNKLLVLVITVAHRKDVYE